MLGLIRLAVLAVVLLGTVQAEERPPNILLIVADDMGWNDLSLTGSVTISTPNLDKLARRGSLFTQFTVAAPICTPSRAAMLTGRLPIRTGVYANLEYPLDNLFRVFYPSSVYCLPEKEVTIGDALKAEGRYSSAMVGKWHLGHNPEYNCLPGRGKQGFDFFYGLPYSHEEGYPGPFPEGLIFPPVPLICDDKFVEQPFNMSDLTSRYTELTTELLLRYGEGQGQGQSDGEDRAARSSDVLDDLVRRYYRERERDCCFCFLCIDGSVSEIRRDPALDDTFQAIPSPPFHPHHASTDSNVLLFLPLDHSSPV
jgi:hypothetical protein